MSTYSVQADKIVNAKITQLEHTMFKDYCSSLCRSMQDLLRDLALIKIQKQCFCCCLVRFLMDENGIEQTPELLSLVLATPVITAAIQRPARLMKLIGFISPARRYVDWLLRNRLISSALTAAASRLSPSRADRVSILQSHRLPMNEPSNQK